MIAGDDFWKGMRQGLIASGLNHAMHMGVDDLWKIEKNKATLIDESSDGIYIESNGSILNLSEYDFTNNMPAAESIVQYYSKDYALSTYHDGGGFELNGGYFSSYESVARVELGETLMSVTLKNAGFLGRQLTSIGRFYLIAGKFSPLLNNKFNMINAIGHEYKHYLDNLQYKSLYNNGFKNIEHFSSSQTELRAIQYQRSLPSWQFTTADFQNNTLRYENRYK